MFQSTVTYIAEHLAEFFFSDKYKSWEKRVVYGDNDSYFKHLMEQKIELPGLVFTLTQVNLPHSTSRPARFRRGENATGNMALVYNARPALLTFSMAIYCQDSLQSFDYLQKYFEFQNSGATLVRYWTDDMHYLDVECSMTNFEDPTVEPAGKKSEDFDSTGLIYEIEGGFSSYSLFLEAENKKIIRCFNYDFSLSDLENRGFYNIEKAEIVNSNEYTQQLIEEGRENYGSLRDRYRFQDQ